MEPFDNLIILTTPVGQFLGKLINESSRSVSLSHLVTLTEPATGKFTLLPEPVPLGLVSEQVGGDMASFFPMASPSFYSTLPLIEDSPHQIVRMFIEYWGLSNKPTSLEGQANSE